MATTVYPLNDQLYSANKKNFNIFTVEILGAFTAALSFFCIGTVRSWTSPGTFSIQTEEPLYGISLDLKSSHITWIAACIPLGAFFGTIFGAPMLQYLGRQKTLCILAIPYIVGWFLIGTASNITMILIGRALTGFSVGLSTAAAQLYVSECARPSIRGVLGLMPAMMLAVGILAGFVLGTWIHWRHSALILCVFPATLLVLSLFLPETPLWLMMHNREEDARKSLKRLRGSNQSETIINDELAEIKSCLDQKGSQQPSFCTLVRRREIWMPLMLVLSLMMFQQLSGISVIVYYLKMILSESQYHAEKSSVVLPLSMDISILIFGLTHFLAFFISIPLIDKGGRKLLLIISAAGMSVSHIGLGIYFVFGDQNLAHLIVNTGKWLPVTALCCFIAAYSIGYASVPYIIMSEVFPSKIRSYLCSVVTLSEQVFCFVVVQIFPPLMNTLQPCFIFWIFATFCLLSILLVLFAVPETKGKSLSELEQIYKVSPKKRKEKNADFNSSGESPFTLQIRTVAA